MERNLGMADVVALAGLVLVAAALILPWQEERTCAPMQDCTAWSTVTGWEMVGWGAVAVVAGILLAYVFLRDPLRRGVAVVVASLGAVALVLIVALDSIPQVFQEARGPMTAPYVFAAGLLVTLVGLGFGLRATKTTSQTTSSA